jgi:hypothetical protein
MSGRKCIYTGKDAEVTDKVVPKEGGDEVHNWSNSVPCSKYYKDLKGLRPPNALELQANRVFKMLELAKLDVGVYKKELARIQKQIVETLPENIQKAAKKIKDKEIELAYIEKEIQEVDLDKVLDSKKMEW